MINKTQVVSTNLEIMNGDGNLTYRREILDSSDTMTMRISFKFDPVQI